MHESRLWGVCRRVNFWLAVLAVGLVIGWRVWVVALQPSHLMDVAEEIGSIAHSKEALVNLELVPNSDGTALVYFQETETGLGTYFHDTATGTNRLLFEHREINYNPRSGMLAWSPDDRLFACAVQTESSSASPTVEIVLYDGASGIAQKGVAAGGFLPDSKFVWLSPHSYAYSSYNQSWLIFQQTSGGNWKQVRVLKRFTDREVNHLTATSARSLAWEQDGELWTVDLVSGASTKIWGSPSNQLTSFTFSSDTGEFTLRCRGESRLRSVRLPSRAMRDGAYDILGIPRVKAWTSYAELELDRGVYTFKIHTDPDAEPTVFVWKGMVEYYKLAGNCLYFTGNTPNGPPGVWQYDMDGRKARCLASGLKKPFEHTTMVTPTVGLATNEAGKQISYHLWQPTGFSDQKKYPLILGQTHYMWFSYPQVAANGGYYYAIVDRVSWADGLHDWAMDVHGAYDALAQHPNIDTNRVFLFATSAEAAYLSHFVVHGPDLWRGLILFNPSSEPRSWKEHLSTMFIVGGTHDYGAHEQLILYQDKAARAGISVKLVLQDGVQHITRSIATERERTRQFARFIKLN